MNVEIPDPVITVDWRYGHGEAEEGWVVEISVFGEVVWEQPYKSTDLDDWDYRLYSAKAAMDQGRKDFARRLKEVLG